MASCDREGTTTVAPSRKNALTIPSPMTVPVPPATSEITPESFPTICTLPNRCLRTSTVSSDGLPCANFLAGNIHRMRLPRVATRSTGAD